MSAIQNSSIFPPNVLDEVFSRVSFTDLLHCERVCKAWHKFLEEHPKIWQTLCEKIFGSTGVGADASGKKRYFSLFENSIRSATDKHYCATISRIVKLDPLVKHLDYVPDPLTCLSGGQDYILFGDKRGALHVGIEQWSEFQGKSFSHFYINNAHSTPVNTLQILEPFALSATKSLKFWKLEELKEAFFTSLEERKTWKGQQMQVFPIKAKPFQTLNGSLEVIKKTISSLHWQGSCLLSGSDDLLVLWDLNTCQSRSVDSSARYTRFIDENRFMSVFENKLLKLWDKRTAQPTKTHTLSEGVKEFRFCEEQLFCLFPKAITRFDFRSEKDETLLKLETSIFCFSPFGKWICCTSQDAPKYFQQLNLRASYDVDFYSFQGEKQFTLESAARADFLQVQHDRLLVGQKKKPQVDIIVFQKPHSP